jgi:membrane protein YqaA with SNARE-associated domain
MGGFVTARSEYGLREPHLPDDISVKRWFIAHAVILAVAAVPVAVLLSKAQWTWEDWWARPAATFASVSVALKLLIMGIYLSLCTTFFPLPTGWIAAGVASREAAIATGVSDNLAVVALATAVVVGLVGAIASTIANLTDYHIFTWMFRHHRIAAIRETRSYLKAAKWFSRNPFLLLVAFNAAPIPIDVVRMLATGYRYPRVPYAAANFIGRFLRYAMIAFVTCWLDLGWVAAAVLLALALVLALWRFGPRLVRKLLPPRANPSASRVSDAP